MYNNSIELVLIKLTYEIHHQHIQHIQPPIHVKRGVIKSLYDRATRVTTHEEDLVKEHMHLKKVFANNDYPEAFLSATLNPIAPKPRENSSNREERKKNK